MSAITRFSISWLPGRATSAGTSRGAGSFCASTTGRRSPVATRCDAMGSGAVARGAGAAGAAAPARRCGRGARSVRAGALRAQACIVFASSHGLAQRRIGQVHALRAFPGPRFGGTLLPVRMQQGHEQVIVLLDGLRRSIARGAQHLVVVRALEKAHAANEV